jgi:hypothetical protein
VIREGKNLKGRVLGLVLGSIGKRVLTRAFENTVKAIDARNDGARAAEFTADRRATTSTSSAADRML